MWPNMFWIQWNSGRMWQMLFIGQRSHNMVFFHRNVPCQTCFLQELAAKLEAMNKTAMEKLSTLMETSEADRKQKQRRGFGKSITSSLVHFLGNLWINLTSICPMFFSEKSKRCLTSLMNQCMALFVFPGFPFLVLGVFPRPYQQMWSKPKPPSMEKPWSGTPGGCCWHWGGIMVKTTWQVE